MTNYKKLFEARAQEFANIARWDVYTEVIEYFLSIEPLVGLKGRVYDVVLKDYDSLINERVYLASSACWDRIKFCIGQDITPLVKVFLDSIETHSCVRIAEVLEAYGDITPGEMLIVIAVLCNDFELLLDNEGERVLVLDEDVDEFKMNGRK